MPTEEDYIADDGTCRACGHPWEEHVCGSGLIDNIPTHRYGCTHYVGEGGFYGYCDCFIDRQEGVQEAEGVN